MTQIERQREKSRKAWSNMIRLALRYGSTGVKFRAFKKWSAVSSKAHKRIRNLTIKQ